MSEVAAALDKGIEEFNRGAFYACHDTLEAIWMEADTDEKPFYQGILQVAVGFYHLSNLNWRGGAILLGEGLSRLRKFEPTHREIAVDALVDATADWLDIVQTAGPEGLTAVMARQPRPFPKIDRTSAS